MSSKAFVILSLCALVFLISLTVAIETSKGEETAQVGDEKRYCGYGCCYYGSYGKCLMCCKDAEEARLMANEAKPQKQEDTNRPVNDEKHGGWGGRGGRGGGGGRCCGPNSERQSEATQNLKKAEESNPVNEEKHGGWGGGGRCCGKEKRSEAKP